MTGTSIDGLDVALVAIEGHGLGMKASVVRCLSRSLGKLAESLRMLAEGKPLSAGLIAETARDISLFHLELLQELIGEDRVDLVAVHGQTVFHAPPLSWQLINPTVIAIGLGVPVVSDLRAADLASCGHGAPITPLADFVLFRAAGESRCVVNLGGFCNCTLLPRCPAAVSAEDTAAWATEIIGFDVCVCNQLLDNISRQLFKTPFDADGKRAASGIIQPEFYEDLLFRLESQATDARSLGTGDELRDWIDAYRDRYSPEDLARSACAAIAETIIRRTSSHDRLILSGGGVRNRTLVSEIRQRAGVPVELSDSYGVNASHREAAAMAVLGALCRDRVPITLPQVTGTTSPPISGTWVLP